METDDFLKSLRKEMTQKESKFEIAVLSIGTIFIIFCFVFGLIKVKKDDSGLKTWAETNVKLDRIIELLESTK